MKKGLLSLLAVALTVVGCQNYDDQFEELKSQIEGVEAQIAGLPDLTSEVNSIKSTVEGLQQALTTVSQNVTANGNAISDNADAIAGNLDAIGDNATAIQGVNALATTNGQGITALQGSVNTVSSTVAANGAAIGQNATAIGNNGTAIGDNATAIASVTADVGLNYDEIQDVLDDLDTVAASITTIEDMLADVATTDDLNTVSSALSEVAADVEEILNGAKSVNQDISMTNDQDIAYAVGVISLGANSPSAFIINGNLTVDLSTGTSTLSQTAVNSATDMLEKIISTLGSGNTTSFTSGSAANRRVIAENLAYVAGNYSYDGADPSDDALVTIKGNVTIGDIGADVLDFQNRTVDGNVTVTAAAASATSVNFTGSEFNGTTGLIPQTVTFGDATYVNVGKVAVAGIQANTATSVIIGYENALSSTLIVTATSASNIDISAVTSVASEVTITATSTTDVNLGAVTKCATLTTTNAVANLDLGSLRETTGPVDLSSTGLDLSSLVSITQDTDLNTSTVAAFNDASFNLKSITSTLTWNGGASGHLNETNAVLSGSGVIVSNIQSVSLKDIPAGGALTALNDSVRTLVLTAQSSDVTLNVTDTANLTSIDITASEDTGFDFDATSANASLTHVTLDDAETADFTGNTAITHITTEGDNRSLVVSGTTALTSLSISHGYNTDYTSAQEVTVVGATKLETLSLASVVRLRAATITGNTSLTIITAPAATDALTGGANPNFTVDNNRLTGAYTNAVTETFPNGVILGTPYEQSIVTQASLLSWKTYINANNVVNSPTYSLDYDRASYGASDFASGTGSDIASATHSASGTIDTAVELGLIQ